MGLSITPQQANNMPVFQYINSDFSENSFFHTISKLAYLNVPLSLSVELVNNIVSGTMNMDIRKELFKVKKLITLFTSYGMDVNQSVQIMLNSPILEYDIKNTTKLLSLYLEIGFSQKEIKELILTTPQLLNYEYQNTLSIQNQLLSIGINKTNFRFLVESTYKNDFTILDYNIPLNGELLKTLINIGMSPQQIIKLILCDTNILRSNRIANSIITLLSNEGVENASIRNIITTCPKTLYFIAGYNNLHEFHLKHGNIKELSIIKPELLTEIIIKGVTDIIKHNSLIRTK